MISESDQTLSKPLIHSQSPSAEARKLDPLDNRKNRRNKSMATDVGVGVGVSPEDQELIGMDRIQLIQEALIRRQILRKINTKTSSNLKIKQDVGGPKGTAQSEILEREHARQIRRMLRYEIVMGARHQNLKIAYKHQDCEQSVLDQDSNKIGIASSGINETIPDEVEEDDE